MKELVKRKATVIMACRDIQSAKNEIAKIRNKISTGELVKNNITFVTII